MIESEANFLNIYSRVLFQKKLKSIKVYLNGVFTIEEIIITKAKPAYTEEIRRICTIGWRQTVENKYDEEYKTKTVENWYNHERVLRDIKNNIYTHVALMDNKVVGTIGGILNNEKESEIYVFYVDDAYRYKGIGKKLLEVFTLEHTEKGAVKQLVSVEEGNTLGLPFYKARGFKYEKKRKRYFREIN